MKYPLYKKFFITLVETDEGRSSHFYSAAEALHQIKEWFPPETHSLEDVLYVVNLAGKIASIEDVIKLVRLAYK